MTILVEPRVNPCILYMLIGVAVIKNDIIEYANAAVTIACRIMGFANNSKYDRCTLFLLFSILGFLSVL